MSYDLANLAALNLLTFLGPPSSSVRTVGGAALADLKRDAFFCGAGAIVSAGALRSTISPTGAAVLCFLTDEEGTDFVGAEEISKLSENLTDFLADVVGD